MKYLRIRRISKTEILRLVDDNSNRKKENKYS